MFGWTLSMKMESRRGRWKKSETEVPTFEFDSCMGGLAVDAKEIRSHMSLEQKATFCSGLDFWHLHRAEDILPVNATLFIHKICDVKHAGT